VPYYKGTLWLHWQRSFW